MCFALSAPSVARAQDYQSAWPDDVTRIWVGPEYWANRLQDWRISNGHLECTAGSADLPMRTVHILTRRLGERRGDFTMSVRVGLIESAVDAGSGAAAGFLVGAGGSLDYRGAALVHHMIGEGGGLFVGMNATGLPFVGEVSAGLGKQSSRPTDTPVGASEFELRVHAESAGDTYTITVDVCDAGTGRVMRSYTKRDIAPVQLIGNVALVSHPGVGKSPARFRFSDWRISGSKVDVFDDRLCGPVICTQYTLSHRILKMTAQLMPVSPKDRQTVLLQIGDGGGWKTVDAATVITPGYTATFRVADWDSGRNIPYRVVHELRQPDGSFKTYSWSGTVRRDPVDKPVIVLAGFTGNHNVAHPGAERGIPWTPDGVWFPHNDVVGHVTAHRPDVLFFSGDQVYEGDSPTRPVISPQEAAVLDYLYKWYLWCWAYRDLTRDIPCVTIPDDHDVYQGNLWGATGRKTDVDNKGGYVMPADWVRMVERTQMSHLPDPYDPTPVDQGIGVYYCPMTWGRIGFAVIEDRKFKSGCDGLAPPTTSGRPDHVIDPDFDPSTADVPGAELLGDRQLAFLRDWAADWRGTDMKAVLSQTVFAGVATHHGADLMYLVADLDSNGWPQSGRNRALSEFRRGFALMIGGDQHLATIVHHGVEDFNDAGWSFAVPSVANFYPRAWNPPKQGANRQPGMPVYTGEFLDGLGNHVTMWAATNPGTPTGKTPAALHDKMPGYGIVKFNKRERTVTLECWPRYADPDDPSTGGQYTGWPKIIAMEDNYGKKAVAYLPSVRVSGMTSPVVQVIDEANGDIVYTLRIGGTDFRPKVFGKGSYTIRVGEPGTEKMRIFEHVRPLVPGKEKSIQVVF